MGSCPSNLSNPPVHVPDPQTPELGSKADMLEPQPSARCEVHVEVNGV